MIKNGTASQVGPWDLVATALSNQSLHHAYVVSCPDIDLVDYDIKLRKLNFHIPRLIHLENASQKFVLYGSTSTAMWECHSVHK